jgi:phage terminase Nu1 subunit (DNA packaging protein)
MSREQTVTTTELSGFLGVTTRQIQRLTEQGVLERFREGDGQEKMGRYPLRLSVRRYINFLRENPGLTDEDQAYKIARSRRMAAEAEAAQLRTARLRGELCRREHVEFLFGRLALNFRSRLLALPSALGRLLLGKTDFNEIHGILTNGVEQALRELARYTAEDFTTDATRDYFSENGETDSQEAGVPTGGVRAGTSTGL